MYPRSKDYSTRGLNANYKNNGLTYDIGQGVIRIGYEFSDDVTLREQNPSPLFPIEKEAKSLIRTADRGEVAFYVKGQGQVTKELGMVEESGLTVATTELSGMGTNTGRPEDYRNFEKSIVICGMVGRPYSGPENEELGFTADVHGAGRTVNNGPDDIEHGDVIVACVPPPGYVYPDTRPDTQRGKKTLILRPIQNVSCDIHKDLLQVENTSHKIQKIDTNPCVVEHENQVRAFRDALMLDFVYSLTYMVDKHPDWIRDLLNANSTPATLLAKMDSERADWVKHIASDAEFIKFKSDLKTDFSDYAGEQVSTLPPNVDPLGLTERFVSNTAKNLPETIAGPYKNLFVYLKQRIIGRATSSAKSGYDFSMVVHRQ